MNVSLLNITPAMARKMLETNTINRPLRPGVVDGLKMAFARGEYMTTHQGIAFADSGEVLDGQHRLTAIAEMPAGFSVSMYVFRGMSKDTFKCIDIGNKRSAADVLRVEQGHSAVARFLAAMVDTGRKSAVTPQALIPYVFGVADYYRALISFAPRCTKTWSSAAVRAAAILRMAEGMDTDYIFISYHALNAAEFDSMSPIVQALYRQQTSGLVRANGIDMFLRAYRAFDSRNQQLAKIQINDTASAIGKVRESIQSNVLGNATAKKKGATIAAPKKVNSANSKAAIVA